MMIIQVKWRYLIHPTYKLMEKEGKMTSEEKKNLNKKEMTEEELNKVAGDGQQKTQLNKT